MRLWRVENRLSQADLAELTEIDRTRIGRIENGVVRAPMLHEAIALRDVTGIPVDDWVSPAPSASSDQSILYAASCQCGHVGKNHYLYAGAAYDCRFPCPGIYVDHRLGNPANANQPAAAAGAR